MKTDQLKLSNSGSFPFTMQAGTSAPRFSEASSAVLITGPRGTIRFVSRSAQRLFRGCQPAAIGTHVFSLIHREDLQQIRSLLQNTARDLGRVHMLRLFTRRDRWEWFLTQIEPLTGPPHSQAFAFFLHRFTPSSFSLS